MTHYLLFWFLKQFDKHVRHMYRFRLYSNRQLEVLYQIKLEQLNYLLKSSALVLYVIRKMGIVYKKYFVLIMSQLALIFVNITDQLKHQCIYQGMIALIPG